MKSFLAGPGSRKKTALVFCTAFTVLLGPVATHATTRTVTSLADSGPGSLRDTMTAAGSGDTINFGVTGVIALTSDELSVNQNLSIVGPGPGSLTIARASVTAFRIFYFDNGTWNLSGVTISNGYATLAGGGIYNGNGGLTISNCVIVGNRSDGTGGGIYNQVNTTLVDSTIVSNTSASDGGGVYSTFNNAGNQLKAYRCTFIGNRGAGGGAIDLLNDGSIQNCTFYGNIGTGNAIRLVEGNLSVLSCTFANNESGSEGAVYVVGSAAVLYMGNSILYGPNGNLYNKSGTISSLGYNLSNDDAGGSLAGPSDQLFADPKLDGAGPMDNGGLTKTIALTTGSPAIDAGNSLGLTTDQRGSARVFDNPGIPNVSGGDGADIGAYEAPLAPLQSGPVYTVNTLSDHDDGMCTGDDCSLREALNRAVGVSGQSGQVMFGVQGTLMVASEVDLPGNVTITGPGARLLSLSGGGTSRVLGVGQNVTAGISGVTIRDGNPVSAANHDETIIAGGLLNTGQLGITNCSFLLNSVFGATNISNGGVGGAGQGGAIFNGGTLYLSGCTFSGNKAVGCMGSPFSAGGTLGAGGYGGAAQGGAIYNNASGVAGMFNCTFNGNTATGGKGGVGSGTILAGGGNANGGAVYNIGLMDLYSSTVSGNTGTGGAGDGTTFRHGPRGSGNGGMSSGGGNFYVISSISAGNSGNTAPDAEGTFYSDGYNVVGIGDQSAGFSATNNFPDQVGTVAAALNAHLGALQNNGGDTDTMGLLYGSPAIDRGISVFYGPLAKDQRGMPRTVVTAMFMPNFSTDGTDVGAVEMNLLGGPDSNHNGMSDDFESFYGLTDPSGDADGDGMSNLQEFIAGTNPLDPTSALRIITTSVNSFGVTLTFGTAIAGRVYRLEGKNTLTDANWTTVSGSDTWPTVNGIAQIRDASAATNSMGFYRVMVVY